jgi:asparagine synthase (glutamine-hydrolysing)
LIFSYEGQEEEGFFKNIYELLPSYTFTFNLKTFEFKKWKYYNLKWNSNYEKFSEEKLAKYSNEVRELIFRAVDLRLRSDVAVGTCLSGGLDSSTIACTINELLKSKNIEVIGEYQKVFTASFDDNLTDETKWAQIVVNKIKAQWFKTYPTEESLLKDLDDLIYTQEIPFGSTSIYAQYKVMQITKESGVKVLLDGQGGDELFTGYTSYYPTFFYEILKNFDFKTFFTEYFSLKNSPIDKRSVIRTLKKILAAKIFSKNLVKTGAKKLIKKFKYINPSVYKFSDERMESYLDTFPSSLNEQLYQFITIKNLKTLLKYEDRNSMRFSIEARTPFADDINLIEHVFQLPSVYKIHNGWSKYILRQAMKNILPEEILKRKDKIGFATPEKTWLKTKKDFIINIITENKNIAEDFLNIKLIIQDIKNEKIYKEGFLLWKIINFILWRKKFRV